MLLHCASLFGLTETVREQLLEGADVNARAHETGVTALLGASRWGHEQTVRLLLRNGADVDVQDVYGHTTLDLACLAGCAPVMQLLLDHNVSISHPHGTHALWTASTEGHFEIVKMLIELGVDVNAKSDSVYDYDIALVAASACYQNSWRDHIVQLLLDSSADINARSGAEEHPGSALEAALKMGHQSTVQLLVSRGADHNLVRLENLNRPGQLLYSKMFSVSESENSTSSRQAAISLLTANP